MPVHGPFRTWYSGDQGKRVLGKHSTPGYTFGSCAAVCPDCSNPFGVIVKPSSVFADFFALGDPERIDAALQNGAVWTIPKSPRSFSMDQSLPAKIREPFVFAQEDAALRRNASGILSTARGCLDVALKELGEKTGGRRDRINNLRDKGIITGGIATWSQTLWEEGSDAAHDLEADMERAIEHVAFLRLFFEVAFSLPARIASASHAVPASGED